MFRDVILSVNDLLQMVEDEFSCRIKRMYWGGYREDLLKIEFDDEELQKKLACSCYGLYYTPDGCLRGKAAESPQTIKKLWEDKHPGDTVVCVDLSPGRDCYFLKVRGEVKKQSVY